MEQFRSQSEALVYLEDGKQRGQYADCGNLKLTDMLIVGRGRLFSPYCKKHSLVEHRAGGYGNNSVSGCPQPVTIRRHPAK